MTGNNAFETFIAVEFEQRKALIRRDGDYQATIDAIKQLIGAPLRDKSAKNLVLSVYIGTLNDSCDMHPAHWGGLLPHINHVIVRITSVEITVASTNDLATSHDNQSEAPPPAARSPSTRPTRSASVLSISDSEDEEPPRSLPSAFSSSQNSANNPGHQEDNSQGRERKTRAQRHKRERDSAYSESSYDEPKVRIQRSRKRKIRSSRYKANVAGKWIGPPRGVMRTIRRKPWLRTANRGLWSYSGEGTGSPTTTDRAMGDIHFASDRSCEGGFRYWVVTNTPSPKWTPYTEWKTHPTIPEYRLRPSRGGSPPGWILESSMGLFYQRLAARDSYSDL
ncbi:hypothetical protein RhiJN_09627 [Ceratobasidium sp. AG-Ba]|nr:hypothetical protein RhiJN_09627 [Ceratobasidium sp. AG-Ba]